ncbi:MAG: hypothetical protein JJU07_06985 [Natronohydrobacter sp.]|nr:hypothetical protein [Natronohydrobacter sp.]
MTETPHLLEADDPWHEQHRLNAWEELFSVTYRIAVTICRPTYRKAPANVRKQRHAKIALFWLLTDNFDTISTMGHTNKRGGKRPGAGRPKGSVNLRSKALADQLLREGHCPATALTRLAQQAEEKGNLALTVDAWKALLPYIHPKPKPVEVDPEGFLALNAELTDMRARAAAALVGDYAEALAQAENRAGIC